MGYIRDLAYKARVALVVGVLALSGCASCTYNSPAWKSGGMNAYRRLIQDCRKPETPCHHVDEVLVASAGRSLDSRVAGPVKPNRCKTVDSLVK